MEGLEQVRLAGTVRSDDENDPVGEQQVEGRVGAILTERQTVDQPARRIGMIRYT
jgi:hypothetical protein